MMDKKIKVKKQNIYYLIFVTLLTSSFTIAYSIYFLKIEALAQQDNASQVGGGGGNATSGAAGGASSAGQNASSAAGSAAKKTSAGASSAGQNASSAAGSFSTYENSPFGIKMSYPQDWRSSDYGINPAGNSTVAEFIGPTKNPTTTAPSVNLFVFSSVGNVSLSNLINNTLNQIEAVDITPTKAIQLKDNTTAYQTVYQISTRHNIFEKMQTYTVKNGLIYVLTYTATPADYSLYLPTVRRMIDSFTISNVKS